MAKPLKVWNGTSWTDVAVGIPSGIAPLSSPTFTGNVTLPTTTSIGNVSSTELGYLDGVTSSIQTQLDSKASSNSPTLTGTITTTGATIANPTFSGTVDFGSSTILNSQVLLPSQTGNNGKVLTTNGTTASWGVFDSSVYALVASPTFTGTATFANITVTGTARFQETAESVTEIAHIGNTLTADYMLGNIFFMATAFSAAGTINLTNVPTEDGRAISVVFMITQGATGYNPTSLTVNSIANTIRWTGGVAPTPTSSAGKIDIYTFNLIRRAGSYIVLGSMVGNF